MIDVPPLVEAPEVLLPVACQVEPQITIESDIERLDVGDARHAVGARCAACGGYQIPAPGLENQSVGLDYPGDLLGFCPA